MKKLVKGLTALLILGSFIFLNCENAEAAEVADLTANSAAIQEMARHHHFPPPPPPPPHHRHRHDFPHYDIWRDPPPPPPPHHRDRHDNKRGDKHRQPQRH